MSRFAGIVGMLFVFATVANAEFNWATGTSMLGKQYGAANAAFDGSVYLAGGETAYDNALTTVRFFDTTWHAAPGLLTARTHGSAGVLTQQDSTQALFVVGGVNAGHSASIQTVEKLTAGAASWVAAASVPQTVGNGTMVNVVNNRLYAMGGESFNGGTVLTNNQVYNPITNAWTTATSLPGPRFYSLSAVAGDKIYVFGGSTDPGSLTSVLIYDTATDTWDTSAPDMPRRRQQGGVFMKNNLMYLFGGVDYGTLADKQAIDIFDTQTKTWLSSDSGPNAALYPDVTQLGDNVYIMGDLHAYANAQDVNVGTFVPEPGTALTLFGLVGLLGLRRSRRTA